MDYLPLFFNLKDQPVLLIGGGEIALRKARLLNRAGAATQVVATAVHKDLPALVSHVHERPYSESDLQGKVLVVAATDDSALNETVSKACRGLNLPVNVVDQPELCTVIFPAIVDRDPVTIAVSSGGKAPILTRTLRGMIESTIPAAYGELAKFAGSYRDKVKQSVSDMGLRRRFWESILNGPVAEMVLAGKKAQAERLMQQALADPGQSACGEVYLVGAGPGDPDLLTFKAQRLMQQADVVLYDRLVPEAIVNLCRADAERIYVGKARDKHALPQEQINDLLVHYAEQGHRVLRLKGGDPFIFGRGGEEIDQLAEKGIPFQVIPGITAAAGCASYSGIPLTHRDFAQSVRFVTGHLKDGSTNLNWKELVHADQTVVFYMGLVGLPIICRSLIENGRDPQTPIALIQQGTTQNQRVIIGSLENMEETIAGEEVHAPTLLIVGEVVSLHDKLNWYQPD